MITVALRKGSLRVAGHSGAAPKGEDIVCSAISALCWALIYGLQQVLGLSVRNERIADGEMAIHWDDSEIGPEGRAVIETIRGAILEIAKKHPDRVRIEA